jgi:uncharacterized GH25 family protein
MNSKTLLIILGVMAVVIIVLGQKVSVGSNSDISLSTNPNPLRPGPATFMIDVKDKSGKPVDNASVSFNLNMTTMDMGAQKGVATAQGNGRYVATGTMSMRGPWGVHAVVKLPDGSIENKDFTLDVP